MLRIKTVIILAQIGVLCLGIDRPGWPEYKYFPAIEGWLKVHNSPLDWETAQQRCHDEGALLASPWSDGFTSTITHLQASMKIPAMYSGAGLRQGSSGIPMQVSTSARCFVFQSNGNVAKHVCYEALPFACYAEKSLCAFTGYEYFSGTGNCYKLHEDGKFMQEAKSICSEEGAYLAKSNSATELEYLQKLVSSIAYIDNDDGSDRYRHLFQIPNEPSDYNCDEKHPFICESSLFRTSDLID